MKKNIFITGSAGFIGFSIAQSLLDSGHYIHGNDGMTEYYDVRLKRARNKILKDYKNFTFTEAMLENEDVLKKTIDFKKGVNKFVDWYVNHYKNFKK